MIFYYVIWVAGSHGNILDKWRTCQPMTHWSILSVIFSFLAKIFVIWAITSSYTQLDNHPMFLLNHFIFPTNIHTNCTIIYIIIIYYFLSAIILLFFGRAPIVDQHVVSLPHRTVLVGDWVMLVHLPTRRQGRHPRTWTMLWVFDWLIFLILLHVETFFESRDKHDL